METKTITIQDQLIDVTFDSINMEYFIEANQGYITENVLRINRAICKEFEIDVFDLMDYKYTPIVIKR